MNKFFNHNLFMPGPTRPVISSATEHKWLWNAMKVTTMHRKQVWPLAILSDEFGLSKKNIALDRMALLNGTFNMPHPLGNSQSLCVCQKHFRTGLRICNKCSYTVRLTLHVSINPVYNYPQTKAIQNNLR